eukprot:1160066-Pelagomonas_calceolata.AAC.2
MSQLLQQQQPQQQQAQDSCASASLIEHPYECCIAVCGACCAHAQAAAATFSGGRGCGCCARAAAVCNLKGVFKHLTLRCTHVMLPRTLAFMHVQKLQQLQATSEEERRRLEAHYKEKLKTYDEKLRDVRRKEREFIVMQKLKLRTEYGGRKNIGACANVFGAGNA